MLPNNKLFSKKRLNDYQQKGYLLTLLVRRNIKNQYYRSFLGVFWTVLNPLLNMFVTALIFSILLRDSPDKMPYPVYILSGTIIFNLMRSATASSTSILVDYSSMLQKTKVSLGLFPTANTFSALATFVFSFIALILVSIYYAIIPDKVLGTRFFLNWQTIFVLLELPALVLFSLGISYFLTTLFVFFRDIKHLYESFILTLWGYLTPVFFTTKTFLNGAGPIRHFVIYGNPMYYFVNYFRNLIVGEGLSSSNWMQLLICYGWGIASFIIGYSVLHFSKNKIIAHL